MKKNVSKKVIALALVAALMAVAVCGCASPEAEDVEPAEEAVEETAEETAEESVKAYAEWTVKDVAALKGIVSGITNRQYAAGEGANRVINGDINYDNEIVNAVQLNTASVLFDTLGEYGMNYWVYFNLPALTRWMAENGVNTALDGLGSDADVLCVKVDAMLLVTEGNPWTKGTEEEDPAEETATVTASAGSTATTASSSKSGDSSSSCNHNWVAIDHGEVGHYESVCVQRGYEEYIYSDPKFVCKKCGYETYDDDSDMTTHIFVEHGGKSSYKVVPQRTLVYHEPVYEDQWVVDMDTYITYKCSKCGLEWG